MVRAALYVVAAALIWMIEGLLFGHLLRFSAVQMTLTAFVYLALVAVAVRQLLKRLPDRQSPTDTSAWRYLSLAPMVVMIVGSFVSLPLILLIVAVGKVLPRGF